MREVDCTLTYGNITKVNRGFLGLEKSHANDAVAISGIEKIKNDAKTSFYVRQVRIKKRSLHESKARKGRKTKNIEAKRNAKNTRFQDGFWLNDRVNYNGIKGFITGFCKGGVYVKDYNGEYITKPGALYKQLPPKKVTFISHTRGWQYTCLT